MKHLQKLHFHHSVRRNRHRKEEQGQALIEFALMILILFVMLIGVSIIAQGFNLQMALYGAAYEGARIWAKNPVRGGVDHCSPPACDPNSGTANNFEKYVAPAVREYMTNQGFDGSVQTGKLFFFSKDSTASRNALEAISRDPLQVKVTLLYSIDLPFNVPSPGFDLSYKEIQVIASCTMKRGG
ncbi:MAG: pilus assembly protein [Acidobacteria bacterium]|nr:pilus assembly protein [Acidobacteriota bacterium]